MWKSLYRLASFKKVSVLKFLLKPINSTMKTTFLTLATAFTLSFACTGCDRDGNTGNGANDPTDQFESDKVKKNADFYGRSSQQGSDSTAAQSTEPATVDTTVLKNGLN